MNTSAKSSAKAIQILMSKLASQKGSPAPNYLFAKNLELKRELGLAGRALLKRSTPPQ